MKNWENKNLQATLKLFKTGKLPAGYNAKFFSGLWKEGSYSERGTFLKNVTIYDTPYYEIRTTDGDSAFSIVINEDETISVAGESNQEPVKNWEEAVKLGLIYEKEGY